MDYKDFLNRLTTSGNLRTIPQELSDTVIDMSTNDYMGYAADASLQKDSSPPLIIYPYL